jgi:Flp pilus assembly CpaF family ATPase
MQTRPARADRPEVDLRRLVSGFLRMAPDVAIVGEVRDLEELRTFFTQVQQGYRRAADRASSRSTDPRDS